MISFIWRLHERPLRSASLCNARLILSKLTAIIKKRLYLLCERGVWRSNSNYVGGGCCLMVDLIQKFNGHDSFHLYHGQKGTPQLLLASPYALCSWLISWGSAEFPSTPPLNLPKPLPIRPTENAPGYFSFNNVCCVQSPCLCRPVFRHDNNLFPSFCLALWERYSCRTGNILNDWCYSRWLTQR